MEKIISWKLEIYLIRIGLLPQNKINNDEHDATLGAKKVTQIDSQGNSVSPGQITSPLTGFGEVNVAQNNAFIQASATYNFLPSNFRDFTSGTGSTEVANKLFVCKTGTGVGGYGAIQSFRALNYKPGSSGLARFTALFESNAANSWQGVGLVNLGDELSFGYNGNSFGIWHRYGGLAEVRTLTITGAATGSETLTLTLNGVAYSIPLTSGSVEHNAWEIE